LSKQLKIASYYGIREWGQCKFWDDCLGNVLPDTLGKATKKKLNLYESTYDIFETDFNISYCDFGTKLQKPILPNKRPKGFVYSFMTDPSDRAYEFIEKIQPNLLCCLQVVPKELFEYSKQHNCDVIFCPWFIRNVPQNTSKNILAMCSGNIQKYAYVWRTAIYNYLKNLNRDDIVLSCGIEYGKYPLTRDEYQNCLSKTKYYFSGPVREDELPEKYFEACNYGAALVCPKSLSLESCGFIPNKSYIVLQNIEQIPKILSSSKWKTIGAAGQKLVNEFHTVQQRKQLILKYYKK